MKNVLQKFLMVTAIASVVFYFSACEDESDPGPQLTGTSKTYTLGPVSNPAIDGTVTFAQRDDDKVVITIQLTGTQAGGSHPAHIHANPAAAGGAIVLDLSPVNGADGKSETVVETLKDGTPITYEGLLDYNGHVNVHASESDLTTLIAQGDIGGNELTGDTKVYTPSPVANPAIGGTLTIAKRKRGTSLVTVALTGTTAGSYSSHFHANNVAFDGPKPITINLTSVDGTTGMAVTSVDTLNTGDPITYDELLNYNGHFNVHGLGSYLVQADIGSNELIDTKVYTVSPVADPSIGGTLTIAKRKKGTSLVTVALTGTPAGTYQSHFHANTVAFSGSKPITINLKAVDGTTGKAVTNVDTLNNGDPITYDELLNYNGHFNVHGLGSYVVQADIGQNELTGVHEHYDLSAVGGSGVTGMASFDKRKNGKALITLALVGTTAGGDHPAHIHANNVATTGGIVLDLKNVSGATGKSATSVDTLNDGTAVTYDELVNYNGHINVHASSSDLTTILTQGNIGSAQ